MSMKIERVNTYSDNRFSEKILLQHGCFLVDNKPYEVEIISETEAVVKGERADCFKDVIDEFRLYAPFISAFYDQKHHMVAQYSSVEKFLIPLNKIQPSQFYVDQDKLNALSRIMNDVDKIIVPVIPYGDRYISLDGHSRLYYAWMQGWMNVWEIIDNDDNSWVDFFVEEAQKRNIFEIRDMKVLPHEEYEEKWNGYCEKYFMDN